MSVTRRPIGPATRAAFLAALSALALLLVSSSSASAAASTQYWLTASKTAPTTHCYTGYGSGSYTDLLDRAPTGITSSIFTGSAQFGCTQPFANGAKIGAGSGTLEVYMTNTGRDTCYTPWWLQHAAVPRNVGTTITGTNVGGNGGIAVPPYTKTPLKITVPFTVPDTTLPPGDQLMTWIDVRTGKGACSATSLYYSGASTPSNISLPTLVG